MTRNNISAYLKRLARLLTAIQVTSGQNKVLSLNRAAGEAVKTILAVRKNSRQVILVGNGGSAAIASHQAMDLWRTGGVRALAFNDAVELTCLGNDFGYDKVFSKPVEMFAEKGDLLLAISSSGRSLSILNAVRSARKKGCSVMTFSGFAPDNPLRALGDLNFYVASDVYGLVEAAHLALIHAISDGVSGATKARL